MIHELSLLLADAMIEHAKLLKKKDQIASLVRAETKIIELRHKINDELNKISKEKLTEIETEE